jgi:hypothetical protein
MNHTHAIAASRQRTAFLAALAAFSLCFVAGCSASRASFKADPPASLGADPPASPEIVMAQYEAGEWATRRSYVPASLSAAGMHAEAIFAEAAANNWQDAQDEFRWFVTGVRELDADIDDQEALKGQLNSALMALGAAINAEDRQAVLGGANNVLGILALMEEPLNPAAPVYVKLLGVYGRQIELVAPSGDTEELAALASAIHGTWYAFRPRVALMFDDVNSLDSIVSGLDSATLPSEYEDYAKQLLSVVSGMEASFSEQAAGAY